MAVLVLALVGCGGADGGGNGRNGGDGASAGEPSGTITVSAAASLTEAFTRIGEDYEAEHPGTEVTFNFDSSTTLATQIVDGAPADVYASADERNMDRLVHADKIDGRPRTFARNEMVIVTEPDNPERIEELADLRDAGVVSLCGAEVPCGRFATTVLEQAGVAIDEGAITRGQNVRATLTAVTEGDAVAAIVYATDAAAAGDAVHLVEIPAGVDIVAAHPIGVVRGTGNQALARAFVDHVLGDGQAVLAEHGFEPPR